MLEPLVELSGRFFGENSQFLEKIRIVTSIVNRNKPESSRIAFGLGQIVYHEVHGVFTYLSLWNVRVFHARAVAGAGIW